MLVVIGRAHRKNTIGWSRPVTTLVAHMLHVTSKAGMVAIEFPKNISCKHLINPQHREMKCK